MSPTGVGATGVGATDAEAPRAWPRVKWTRAGQVAALPGDGLDLVPVADLAPATAFARLRAADAVAATRFVAHCLPRMDAAQWLAACLTRGGPAASPVLSAAAEAVRHWVAVPSEEARRIAGDVGEAAGWSTAQGAACLAIFLSGGSMAPASQEAVVAPPPGAFGRAVAAAVLLVAHADGPVAAAGRLSGLLDLADAFAAGERPMGAAT